MKKIVIYVCVCMFLTDCLSQASYIKQPSLLFQATLLDFKSANNIRISSLGKVIKNKEWAQLGEMKLSIAAGYISGINKRTDFSVGISAAWLKYPLKDYSTTISSEMLSTLNGSINLKLFEEQRKFSPYVTSGLSICLFKKNIGTAVPAGLGMQLRISKNAQLYSVARYNIPITGFTNYHFDYTLGISGSIRRRKPVIKVKNKERNVVLDADGDGVSDAEDRCPVVYGYLKYSGCPIPDTDFDGISDEEDNCITIPGVLKYNGCPVPDADGDGIDDEQDHCPNIRGTIKYYGCSIPDSDKDGINDETDQCPLVYGDASNNGCPQSREATETLLNKFAALIYFDISKSSIKKESYAVLDSIAILLLQVPGLKVRVEGHTDNSGSANSNMLLSSMRALAVCKYLVRNGVSSESIEAKGFGDLMPVVGNNTVINRSKNRRVVFKIFF